MEEEYTEIDTSDEAIVEMYNLLQERGTPYCDVPHEMMEQFEESFTPESMHQKLLALHEEEKIVYEDD